MVFGVLVDLLLPQFVYTALDTDQCHFVYVTVSYILVKLIAQFKRDYKDEVETFTSH